MRRLGFGAEEFEIEFSGDLFNLRKRLSADWGPKSESISTKFLFVIMFLFITKFDSHFNTNIDIISDEYNNKIQLNVFNIFISIRHLN